jgi:hypothetical protein
VSLVKTLVFQGYSKVCVYMLNVTTHSAQKKMGTQKNANLNTREQKYQVPDQP